MTLGKEVKAETFATGSTSDKFIAQIPNQLRRI
jgi:hypothetical protein